MRLTSFLHDGKESYGAVVDSGVIDFGHRLGDRLPTLRDALEADALTQLERESSSAADLSLDDISFLPVIPLPRRIVGIGVNYRQNLPEGGADPTYPSIFLKLPSSVVGHGQPIIRPRVSEMLDFEGELAVIIGKKGRRIAASGALDHVAGYTCFNDTTIRDWQRHGTIALPGKNFFRCGSCGPWLVTADEVGDPSKLWLKTVLNGVEMQDSSTEMIFDVATLIEYVSGFTPLEAGDVIATGTPNGVGMQRNPPVWLKDGDVIEVTISGIGTLLNPIEDESDA